MKISKRIKKTEVKKYLPFYIMALPAVIYLIINNYIPMFGLFLAFKKINFSVGIWESAWTGLSNFTYLFKTRDAFIIFRNTICYNLVFIVLGTVLSVVMAITLNEIARTRSKKFYQTVILLPFMISTIILSYMVNAFLASSNGFINKSILEPLGADMINWYSSAKYWPVILTVVYLWKNVGYSTIIYYASVVSIDKTYYEAAEVDGAGFWKKVWHITLPGLKPTIIIMLLMSLGRMFYSDFGLFYQVPMNNGILYPVTNTIDTYVYRGLMELNDVGRSSAAAFTQSILGFILILGSNMLVRKSDKNSALF